MQYLLFIALMLFAMPSYAAETAIGDMDTATISCDDEFILQEDGETVWNKSTACDIVQFASTGGLSDVDLTGVATDDLLYRSSDGNFYVKNIDELVINPDEPTTSILLKPNSTYTPGNDEDSIIILSNASLDGNHRRSVMLLTDTTISNNHTSSVMIGSNISTQSNLGNQILIGYNITSGGGQSNGIAIGVGSTTFGWGVALGQGATQESHRGIALGKDSTAEGNRSSAVGDEASATGTSGSIAFGVGSSSSGDQSIAIGSENFTTDNSATASADRSIAIGPNTTASHEDSVAFGPNSTTTATDQIMFGSSYHMGVHPGDVQFQSGTIHQHSSGDLYLVAELPASPDTGSLYIVSDGSDGSDCSTGSGSDLNICIYDGTSYTVP